MYDISWNDQWTKTSKPLDHDRPFHRIDSPSFDGTRLPVSGRGFDCGCRSPNDYDPDTFQTVLAIVSHFIIPFVGVLPIEVSRRLLRTMPAWVPVEREHLPQQAWQGITETEKEVEGVLTRSFQTWTDVPVKQWHLWYDWNFHVVPAKGYKYLRGKGNDEEHGGGGTSANPPGHDKSMECEWDCGAFGNYAFDSPGGELPSLSDPGPMFNRQDGRDWAWPMAGQYVWIAGRWIYDCGHSSSDDKSMGLMRSELHPCTAVATARWEAVKFDENERYVPAIQFMFFASRKGGYINKRDIGESSYDFIIDLPEYQAEPIAYPVGHTPDFPLNTLVIRPRLLIDLDYRPFTNANGSKARPGDADPEVELLPPKKQGDPPRQAKIRIPLTKLSGKGVDSYGVIVSLGWHDPLRTLARTIKKVVIGFTHVHTRRHHDDPADYQIKVAVNGRWFALFAPDLLRETRDIGLGHRATIYLAEEEHLFISAHGMEENEVGEVMRESSSDRTLKDPDGAAYSWRGDIDQRDDDHAAGVARAIAWKMAKTFAQENEKLGLIDPGHRLAGDDTVNPLQVKELIRLTGGPHRPLRGRLNARVPGKDDMDYTLHYMVHYEDQPA